MSEYYFIVNPISGSGRGLKYFTRVQALLEQKGVDYAFRLTEHPGHAVALAGEALARGEKRIVAAGGDGTAQEVASVLSGTGVPMGLLPFGTGNDFAFAAGIPAEPERALELLLRAAPVAVDCAEANGACFLNVAGFGFDVDVVRYTAKFKKRFNGMLPYMLGVFQSLLHLTPRLVTITANGETFSERAVLVNACNGARFAGGIRVAPGESLTDGLLDVCLLRELSIPAFLWTLPKYIKGTHTDDRHVRYFRASELRVETDLQSTLDLDGELREQTPVVFRCRKGQLNLIAEDPA